MRVFTGILLLTYLTVLLNSIELSAQRINRVENRRLPTNVLPAPFYYDAHHEIRARGFPNAVPVIRGQFLIGMMDGHDFHSIVDQEEEHRLFMVDLERHVLIEQSGPEIDARLLGHHVPLTRQG